MAGLFVASDTLGYMVVRMPKSPSPVLSVEHASTEASALVNDLE